MRVVSSIVKASRKPWDPYWDWISRTEPRVCGTPAQCKATPLLERSARQWLVWNEHMELYADARFRVEDTSPRDVCRLARFPERICGSDGRFHTTSSKVIQPVVEPRAPADGHTGVDHLAASWAAIEAADGALAADMKAMTTRYGYHHDPALHPQSLSTEAFRAGGLDAKPGGRKLHIGERGAGRGQGGPRQRHRAMCIEGLTFERERGGRGSEFPARGC